MQIIKALTLLQEKSPNAYAIASESIGRIEQSKRSGMCADKNPPVLMVSDRTAMYSVTWCAGVIAHDSFHSKLYHDYQKQFHDAVPDGVWTGQPAEIKCIRHQLNVLTNINAPGREIDYCRTLDGTHYDLNKDGKYSFDDYLKRNW